MQETAFFLGYTKKSTMLCFQVVIIHSLRVICKLHYVFLAQVYVVFLKKSDLVSYTVLLKCKLTVSFKS